MQHSLSEMGITSIQFFERIWQEFCPFIKLKAKVDIYNELRVIDLLHYPAKNDDKSKSQNFH